MKSCQYLPLIRLRGIHPSLMFLAVLCAAIITMLPAAPSAQAGVTWDAGNNTQWWFDPVNWSNNTLPPDNGSGSATDTQINLGTGAWDLGEGVVYDPNNDPGFAATSGMTFPSGYGAQIIDNLYISRNTPETNLLTIKGDLDILDYPVIGRSSGTDGVATTGQITQMGGVVTVPNDDFQLAGPDTSNAGIGNGTYDYRGGTLDISTVGGSGLRMSHGSTSTNGTTGEPTGASGVARFIMHNPTTGGYVRSDQVSVASFAGIPDGATTIRDPDGVNRGVGIFEYHYENSGTRPFQVTYRLTLNNGFDDNTLGTRSSRLELVLDEAPSIDPNGVPNDIGLFDVDFGGFAGGYINGTGDLDNTFSSADASVVYTQGSTVSAIFGGTRYDWTISYEGEITWSDADNSVVDTISASGDTDIVLIGLGSESIGLPGDFDGDGDVDGGDFIAWQSGDTSNPPPDQTDLNTWLANFPTPAQPAATAVPEPATGVLLCLAGIVLAMRRR